MKKRYLALSPNYYGYGDTPTQAKHNLRKAGGKPDRCGLYEVTKDYWIDDFGTAHGTKPAKFVSGTNWIT